MKRHWPFAAATALIAAAPVVAQGPAPAAADFESAMRGLDYRAAALVLDSLARRHRLERKEVRPDPLLNGLFGRLYLRQGLASIALPYLRRSDSADLSAEQRIAAGFALAEAEEAVGEWTAAAGAFERLLALPLSPGRRIEARTGLARVRLADDPAAALALASAAAAEALPDRRWEAELVSAQALSLLGRGAEAELAAQRAWSGSPEAAATESAPMRVALVRAGLAAAAGRRQPMIAMLSAANAGINGIDSSIADSAPICGEGGIAPDDHVTFAAYTRTNSTQWLTPIAASRPAAASLFRKAIAGRRLLAVTGAPPGGLVFTLRCRTAPSGDYALPFAADPWTQYFADRGLYFGVGGDAELEDINRLSDEIDTLSARNGRDHISIIPLRLTLLEKLNARASGATDVSEAQVLQLRRDVAAGLAKAGGAEAFLPDLDAIGQAERLANAGATEQAIAVYRASQERLIARLPPREAYIALGHWLSDDKELPEASRSRINGALLARTGGGARDPIRRALLRRQGVLAREAGDLAAARAAFAAAGLPKDSCASADALPEYRERSLTDEDYPPDALDPNIEGVTVYELDLDSAGRLARHRILLSAPSSLFDPRANEKAAGFAYTPAMDRGRPRACRGLTQVIRWRLPDQEDPGPPTFAPSTESGT